MATLKLIDSLDSVANNRSDFIRKAVEDKLAKNLEALLIEGYSEEKNLDEWDNSINDGIG